MVTVYGHPVTDAAGKVSYVLANDLKGIISAAYSLGAICALPFVPTFSQRFGRRWAIFFGSAVSIVGAIIQGCAQNSMFSLSMNIMEFSLFFPLLHEF